MGTDKAKMLSSNGRFLALVLFRPNNLRRIYEFLVEIVEFSRSLVVIVALN